MEIKPIIDETVSATAAADTASGAVATVIEAAADPVGAARRLERRGKKINQQVAARLEKAAGQAAETVQALGNGSLPERWLVRGLRLVKGRARRRDLIGQAAYRYLVVVHGGLDVAVRTLGRLEQASQPPARGTYGPRGPERKPAPRRRARGSRTGNRLRTAS